MPATVVSRSVWADRKFGRIAGSAPGVADLMWIEPREFGPALADHHRHAGLALEQALLRGVVAGMRHVELHVRAMSRPGRVRTKP